MKNRLIRSVLTIAFVLGFAVATRAQSGAQWEALDSYIQTAMRDAKVRAAAPSAVKIDDAFP